MKSADSFPSLVDHDAAKEEMMLKGLKGFPAAEACRVWDELCLKALERGCRVQLRCPAQLEVGDSSYCPTDATRAHFREVC